MWKKLFGSVQPVYSGINDAACLQGRIPNTDLDIMWNSIKDWLTKNLYMEHRLRVKR